MDVASDKAADKYKHKHIGIAAVALLIAAFATWYFASPWLAMKNLKEAAYAGDSEALRESVDFPAIRESVKEQLRAGMIMEFGNKNSENPFEALGAGIALTMAGSMIDSMISPAGISTMVKSGQLKPDRDKIGGAIEWQIDRTRFNRFTAHPVHSDDRAAPILVFKRDGLGWKLVDVTLPDKDEKLSKGEPRSLPSAQETRAKPLNFFEIPNNKITDVDCDVSVVRKTVFTGGCTANTKDGRVILFSKSDGCTIDIFSENNTVKAGISSYRNACAFLDNNPDLASKFSEWGSLGTVVKSGNCWLNENVRACASDAPTSVAETNSTTIPKIFLGKWGTSADNCDSKDDYGPMEISPRGFFHYEVNGQAKRIKQTGPNAYIIQFGATDIGSDEPISFEERWEYDAASRRLIATTFQGTKSVTQYRRCN